MSDLNVSISRLTEHRSNEKEVFTAINLLRAQALLRFETSATASTAGDGTYVPIWSATIPLNSSWYIDTTVVGRGTAGGASFEKCLAVQNYAGTVTVIGGTAQGTFIRRDSVAMDSKFNLTGDLLTYEVRDDAVQAMTWKAFIVALGTNG